MSSNFKWSLTTIDTGIENVEIVINFPPEEFTIMPGGGVVNEFGGYGMPYPILQWVRGLADEITFNSLVWYEDLKDYGGHLDPEFRDEFLAELGIDPSAHPSRVEDREDVLTKYRLKGKVELIKSLTQPITKLGRPPICRFQWSSWSINCLVVNISNITPMVPDSKLDHPMGYTFNVTLKKYVEYSNDRPDDEYTGWTKYISAVEGDTYELIAWREYGDPQLGVSLRRLNPSKVVLSPGDRVMIPSKDWARTQTKQSRRPVSPIFSSSAFMHFNELYDYLS